MRTHLISLAFLSAIPAAAHAEGPYRIVRDGVDAEYSVTALPNGSRRITGTYLKTGEQFWFTVNGRYVSGKVGDYDVSFRAPKPAKLKRVEVLASK